MIVKEIKVTYDRKTRKKIKTEVIREEVVDEKEFYKPLIKMYGDTFLESIGVKKEGVCLGIN